MSDAVGAPKKNIVVFISGNGSNLQALIDATQSGVLDAKIALVVSNKAEAYGLTRAADAGIETLIFPYKPYKKANRSRWDYDADLAEALVPYNPEVIVLAGFMRILSHEFLARYPSRVINLHPALPGKFPGLHAIERAYDAYRKCEIDYSGCMVHVAVPEVDAGPVIAQAMVPMKPSDTLERFENRMHSVEHRLIILATQIAMEAVSKS